MDLFIIYKWLTELFDLLPYGLIVSILDIRINLAWYHSCKLLAFLNNKRILLLKYVLSPHSDGVWPHGISFAHGSTYYTHTSVSQKYVVLLCFVIYYFVYIAKTRRHKSCIKCNIMQTCFHFVCIYITYTLMPAFMLV